MSHTLERKRFRRCATATGFFTGTKEVVSAAPMTTEKFRWDRLTYSSALGYALLVGGLSVGVVLGELRHQFHLSGVIAALHGSTFGFASILAGIFGVKVVDRLGRRTSLATSAVAIATRVAKFFPGPPRHCTLARPPLARIGGALLVDGSPALVQCHHR